ncbi:MAG: hypothetical protein C0624_04400 [Desulfuromonas sp.]|nr:MAG: hypothetical protein C0624_04400 [Desulfuromonas sp.]
MKPILRPTLLLALFLCGLSAHPSLAVTVLFPATDAASPTAGEVYRINIIQGLPNHTAFLVDENAPNLAQQADLSDVVYINSEVNSARINTQLRDTCIGVVIEEGRLFDDFGISSNIQGRSGRFIDIVDNTHPITSSFPVVNNLEIFSATETLNHLTGTISTAASANFLAKRSAETTTQIVLTYFNIGDPLNDGVSFAAGRRVTLPWGQGMNFAAISNITPNGVTLMQNAVLWAEEVRGCKQLVKRAYLSDGTQLVGDGTETLPRGTTVQFVIYFNNPGVALTDIEIQDVLDPTFVYQSDTMRTTTMTACANVGCDATEEQNIYDTVRVASLRSDNPDGSLPGGDEVSYTAGTLTIEAGDQTSANSQLDVNANTLWALFFEAKVAL